MLTMLTMPFVSIDLVEGSRLSLNVANRSKIKIKTRFYRLCSSNVFYICQAVNVYLFFEVAFAFGVRLAT